MKILYLFICLLLSGFGIAYGQGLTQSADGKSTIPIKGSAIGIDLSKPELSLGLNNLNNTLKASNRKFLYGLEVKVKNEDGIGNLFSSGSIVPAGSGSIFVGANFSNALTKNMDAELNIKKQIENSTSLKSLNKLKGEFRYYISKLCGKYLNGTSRDSVQKDLNTIVDSINYTSDFSAYFLKDKGNTVEEIRVYNWLRQFAQTKFKLFLATQEKLSKEQNELNENSKAIPFHSFTIFVFGGISSISFKKFNKIDSSNLRNSFENIDDKGGNIGIGANYQIRNIWIGATYSFVSTNNFEELTKTEYTLKKTTTIGNQTLTDEKKITGYAGNYGRVIVNNLNFDFVYRLRLDKDAKNSVLINPYLRASVYSRDTSLLINKTNIGTGFYFLGGKFLGGFYVELPDINNNVEKSKPVAQQDLQIPFKRLSFGIVTKFNLSTFMGQ